MLVELSPKPQAQPAQVVPAERKQGSYLSPDLGNTDLITHLKNPAFDTAKLSVHNFDVVDRQDYIAGVPGLVWQKTAYKMGWDTCYLPAVAVVDRKTETEKALIYARISATPLTKYVTLLYYPPAEMIPFVAGLHCYSLEGGPGELNPGILASLKFTIDNDRSYASIKYLQSSIDVKNAIRQGAEGLTADTLRPYGGKFIRLAEAAFSILSTLGIQKIDAALAETLRTKSLKILDAAAEKYGYIRGEEHYYLGRWVSPQLVSLAQQDLPQ